MRPLVPALVVGLLAAPAFAQTPTAQPPVVEGPSRVFTARDLFGLEQASDPRVRPDGRVEWKHHFAHLANALAADPGKGTA